MITRIFGKVIDKVYSINDCVRIVEENEKEITIFKYAPRMTCENKIQSWQQILEYEGEPRYNRTTFWSSGLSNTKIICVGEGLENEIEIMEEKFRADLNECHLYSNKVLAENEANKVEIEGQYNNMIHEFNASVISRTPELESYCKLHKLDPADTDCIELFKLLHPDKSWNFKNGSIIEYGTIHMAEMF